MKKTKEHDVEEPAVEVAEPCGGQDAGPVDGGADKMPQDGDEAGAGDADAGGDVDVEALVAEAEQRGYLRGRNERIEELMSRPGLFERCHEARSEGVAHDEKSPLILKRERVSIWDR